MRSHIEIKREYSDGASAERVIRALLPDNRGVPADTKIAMHAEGSVLIMEVSSNGDLPSFLRTVDDLLLCLQAAEGALRSGR
jgi:hypothetical protein